MVRQPVAAFAVFCVFLNVPFTLAWNWRVRVQGQRHLNSTNVDYQPDAIQHMGLFRQWAADVADETALFFCHSDFAKQP